MTRKKFNRFFVVAGLVLLLLGLVLFVTGMSLAGWDFNELSTTVYRQETYTANQSVTSLEISYNNADVRLLGDEQAKSVHVSYPVCTDRVTNAQTKVTVTEEDGTLRIQEEARLVLVSWQLSTPVLTVTVPASELKTLHVVTKNGNIDAGDLVLSGDVAFETKNGEIRAARLHSAALTMQTDAGAIRMEDIVCANLKAETDLGDITLAGTLEADSAEFSTDLGDLELSDGIIDADGVSLSSQMGDIRAVLRGTQQDYSADITWEMGNTNLYPYQSGEKRITIRSSLGDIDVSFAG